MADDRTRDEQEAPSSAESEKGAETTPSPTAEQKEIDEVVADELRDDRFQASDN